MNDYANKLFDCYVMAHVEAANRTPDYLCQVKLAFLQGMHMGHKVTLDFTSLSDADMVENMRDLEQSTDAALKELGYVPQGVQVRVRAKIDGEEI